MVDVTVDVKINIDGKEAIDKWLNEKEEQLNRIMDKIEYLKRQMYT